MDEYYYKEISRTYLSLIIKEQEFPSYKLNILKYLSWNGEQVIRNPHFYGFDADIFPQIRYEKITGWNKFWILSNYTGEIYDFIKQYTLLCRKIIFAKNLRELTFLKKDFSEVHKNLDITVKDNWFKDFKLIFIFFFYHDLYWNDYSWNIIKNLLYQKDFYSFFFKDGKNFFPLDGFYKAIFGLFQGYFKSPLDNEEINEVLKRIKSAEQHKEHHWQNYSKKFYPWEWIYIVRKKLRAYGYGNKYLD